MVPEKQHSVLVAPLDHSLKRVREKPISAVLVQVPPNVLPIAVARSENTVPRMHTMLHPVKIVPLVGMVISVPHQTIFVNNALLEPTKTKLANLHAKLAPLEDTHLRAQVSVRLVNLASALPLV